MEERRVALIVREWGHQSTLYAWTWCKQYLFRRQPDGKLDPQEKFLIVKVGKDDGSDRWKVGGPLIPDLDTACADYPNTVVKLDGSLQNNVKWFIEQHRPDVLVIGENLPSPAMKLTSTSDYVKQSVPVPFVMIRAEAVRNARLRLSTHRGFGAGFGSTNGREASPERFVETPAMVGRRVAVAYPSFAVGRGLMQFLREKVLTPRDTVYICHTFAKDTAMNAIVTGSAQLGRKFVRAMTLDLGSGGGRPSEPEVTEDSAAEFGARELEGFKVHLNVVLRGDPKSALPAFCEQEAIDLLVIGSRSGGLGNRIRKTLSGGSVSGHLIDNAPCPCLVVPHRYLGLTSALDEDMLGTSPMTSSPNSPCVFPSDMGAALPHALTAPPGALAPGALAAQPHMMSLSLGQLGQVTEGSREGSREAGTLASTLVGPAGAGAHSTPSDMLAVLQQQLEEKDRIIAELRAQVQELQLSQAQREARATHDPAATLSV